MSIFIGFHNDYYAALLRKILDNLCNSIYLSQVTIYTRSMPVAQETDVEQLEAAIRSLFQTMKRPQRWNSIVDSTGIAIDRPGALIIQILRATPIHSCRVLDLAVHLGIEAPSVTRKTQELEKAGYIRRIPDAKDKRAVNITLTTLGDSAGRAITRAQSVLLNQALRSWTVSDRRQLAHLMQRLSNDLTSQYHL
jgi:DNA-binding MarR family transcriptional regulator